MPTASKAPQDVKAELYYYKYEPVGLPPGLYDSPHFGQLIAGRVFEVRPDQLQFVTHDPSWSKSSKKQFEDQSTFTADRAALGGSIYSEE